MSEANVPFNPPGQPESMDLSDSVWDEPSSKSTEGANAPEAVIDQPLDCHPNDIFDVSDLDAAAFEDPSAPLMEFIDGAGATDESVESSQSVPSVSANLSSIAAWSQNVIDQIESPNLVDLVTLIQELNQCNGVLMDRVSQLEEALEYSQSALQAEVGRTQDIQSAYNVQDWTTVQEQITTLFNQLEFAHQTNQRQQILIETLTAQLENSQERAAQLEREAALIQQRYSETTQLLNKSEGTCRDLQSRLQRQQRYTLQFKAALEKCLEVPTPQYETAMAAPESAEPVATSLTPEAAFLPKAQRIQPWSAHAHSAAKSPWMKLQHLDLPDELDEATLEPASSENQLNLPSFGLPVVQFTAKEENDAPVAAGPSAQEYLPQLSDDPALKQQLDAAIQPLAEMLAEVLLTDQSSADQAPAAAVEQPQPNFGGSTESTAEELLASTMADAEDALWQDLARLIDVSTEDVVKASLSGDLAAFESIDFNALQPSESGTAVRATVETFQPEVVERISVEAVSAEPAEAEAIAPLVRRISQMVAQGSQPGINPAEESVPALSTPSWPSPVVYPLRPTKKRQSLAMVDLPSFPR